MMPVVGALLGKLDPRKVLAVGLVGAAWSLYALSSLNLNAGYWDIFWPQFVQGASLALLFVPLTTATMDPIPKEEMGNATSMFNLMRNIGGSMGIASGTTFLFRMQQFHTVVLGANVTASNPRAQAMLHGVQARMIAHGSDPVTAMRQSYVAVWGMVQQQAAMQAFIDTFRALGLVFLAVLPLLLIMKKPKHQGGGAAMH
jgi:DHA2 family multidrug resistance protein